MKKEYVLITPAYNEEANIARLIESIVAQTVRPKKWLIVNDGSTDRTGELVDEYAASYGFIEQFRLDRKDVISYYSRKTQVFLFGYEYIKGRVEFDYVGSMDADLSMAPTYYENILKEFAKNPKLGVGGGVYAYKSNGLVEKVHISRFCVPGSIQMFRHKCYEQIGGYIPLKHGGDDTLICAMARKCGWDAHSFPEYVVIQHRRVGSIVGRGFLQARLFQGLTEYGIGTHPCFMIAKTLSRAIIEKPYFIGSCARFVGYISGYVRNNQEMSKRGD